MQGKPAPACSADLVLVCRRKVQRRRGDTETFFPSLFLSEVASMLGRFLKPWQWTLGVVVRPYGKGWKQAWCETVSELLLVGVSSLRRCRVRSCLWWLPSSVGFFLFFFLFVCELFLFQKVPSSSLSSLLFFFFLTKGDSP